MWTELEPVSLESATGSVEENKTPDVLTAMRTVL